jgi:hypothetical protein
MTRINFAILADITKVARLPDADDRFIDSEPADALIEVGPAEDGIPRTTEILPGRFRPAPVEARRLVGIARTSVKGVSPIGADTQSVLTVPVARVPAQAKAVQARIEPVRSPAERTVAEVTMLEATLVKVMHRRAGEDRKIRRNPDPH